MFRGVYTLPNASPDNHDIWTAMKKLFSFYFIGLLAAAPHAPAATITVNTEDNKNFHNGITNLVTAINLLHNGDTIAFNIPNTTTNRHYLETPATGGQLGYPVITNH